MDGDVDVDVDVQLDADADEAGFACGFDGHELDLETLTHEGSLDVGKSWLERGDVVDFEDEVREEGWSDYESDDVDGDGLQPLKHGVLEDVVFLFLLSICSKRLPKQCRLQTLQLQGESKNRN